MKAKMLYLTFAAAAVSPALVAGTMASPMEFDFAKINATIKTAMEPAVATNDLISKFTYEFDPSATDTQNDQYAVKLQIDGKDPSSDKTFSSNTTLLMKHDPAGIEGITNFSMKMDISIDALGFVRHHASKTTACDTAERATGVSRVRLTEDCKAASKLVNVQSFDELHQILREHIDDQKVLLASYHADLLGALGVVENDLTKKSLELQIAEADEYLKAVNEAKLERTVDGVQLKVSNFSIMSAAKVKNFELDLSPSKVIFKCDSSLRHASVIYSAAKPELLQMLKDLENGREYIKPLIQMETRFWLRLMKDHLTRGNQ